MSATPQSDRRRGVEVVDLRRVTTGRDVHVVATATGPWAEEATSRRDTVAVVAAVGQLSEVVDDLSRAVLHALADEPRAVVCDLSGVSDGGDAHAQVLLAAAGPVVRDWPAVPVALPCPDPVLRRRLRRQPMSEHLLFRASLRQALAAVDRAVVPTTQRLRLSPVPTASRMARDFVSRTLLDWSLAQGIAAACLVVSELVTNGLRHAVTDMDLTLARHGGVVRLSLRDRSPEQLREQVLDVESDHGRGLAIVAACSRTWGVLPAADGGKLVWAVLDM
jgi:hypothetical protein